MRVLLFIVFTAVLLVACGSSGPTEEERTAGFHCLSKLNGHHDGLEELVKVKLNDPNSLETLETRITPVGADGLHNVRMKFTAKNALGGRIRHEAWATVNNETCEATLLDII